MKKWLKSLTVIAAIALVLVPCCLFSACNNDTKDTTETAKTHPAAGDLYVRSKLDFDWTGTDYSEEIKESIKDGVEYDTRKLEITSDTEAELISAGVVNQIYSYTIADGKINAVQTNALPGNEPNTASFTIEGDILYGKITLGYLGDNCPRIILTYELSK